MESLLASSSLESTVGSWDLKSGSELVRYRTSSSTTHGLVYLPNRFILSSQLPTSSKSSSSQIFLWSVDKPQIGTRSFPEEPIGPLAAYADAFVFGGGSSGNIYLWQVATGKLLSKWHGHYRTVTCLVLSDDGSLLISAAEDGHIKVWSLIRMFDELGKEESTHSHLYSLYEHTRQVTDVVCGRGLCNSIVISSSEDSTCKIWNLADGRLLRNIVFPSVINAVALDPAEHVFYAGARDGKVYIAALSAESDPNSRYGMYIIGSLSHNSKAITSLAFSADGVTLVSGSEDGMIYIWNTRNPQLPTHILKHGKGPVNNVILVRQLLHSNNQAGFKKQLNTLPPMERHTNSNDEAGNKATVVLNPPNHDSQDIQYCSADVLERQIKELQQRGSSGAVEMELEKLKREAKRSAQIAQQWKKLYQDLQNVCTTELLG